MLKPNIKNFIGGAALVTALMGAPAHAAQEISGAGATFPYPIYAKWADSYFKETGVKLNYQSIGSGGGIKQIEARTVDFGASDAPLEAEELTKAGLMQFPTVMGGVVPVVNVPGLARGAIRLTPELLADIYLGKIKRWDDPALKAINPGLHFPGLAITVVHRSDGSGTTWIFTNYLTKVSKAWAEKVGNDKAVSWPVGVGGKGNEGVASYVSRIKGAIGYVEYAYALQNKMSHARLRNRDGNFVEPNSKTFQAAAASADWSHAPGFYMVLTDQPGEQSWPITGATFILIYKDQRQPDQGRAVLHFFDWAYHHGAKLAESLDYIPMPSNVVSLVERTWHAQVRGPEGQALWSAAAQSKVSAH